jgi:aldose 1-epimerase
MKKLLMPIALLLFIITIFSCQNNSQKTTEKSPEQNDSLLLNPAAFNDTIEGKETKLYILENKNGVKVAFTNLGGRIVGLWVPDKNGKLTDVVVGFGNVKDYLSSTEPYFGATIGRYGNRIAKGKFKLDGKTYTLPINNGVNTLHGGKKGFQNVVWDAEQPNQSTLVLKYNSVDGEEGFPGNLKVKVTYSLNDKNELNMDYTAETDKKTVVNLTNHAFFNLNGEGSGSILNHLLEIKSDGYTPVDSTLIPIGKIDAVANTPFDFNTATAIGKRINDTNEQLKFGAGYDHNFVLKGKGMRHVATLTGDKTGIVMEIDTEEPGLQFYSGNFMQGKNKFKTGVNDEYRTAVALETQHFPDSPNQVNFPSTILSPGQIYHTKSVYRFTVNK